MNEATLLCDRLGSAVDALQERMHAKRWSEFSRKSFLYNLRNTTAGLGDIAALLDEMHNEFRLESAEGAPDVESHLSEVRALLALLERNRTMEEDKQDALRGVDDFYEEQFRTPELYSSLEQKVLSTILKTRYLAERVQVYSRRNAGIGATAHAAQRNILRVLEEKETELQDLRSKYEQARVDALFGKHGAEAAGGVAELEHELSHIARKMEAENAVLNESLSLYRSQVEQLQANYAMMEDRVRGIEELSIRHMGKALELVTLLKKERDYAKKLLLEVQNETADFRSEYSRSLLALEDEKQEARQQAMEQFGKKLQKLERELAERNKMLEHFRSIVAEKERKISELSTNAKKSKR